MALMLLSGGGFSGMYNSASGLRDAQIRLNAASHNIANANTENFKPTRVYSEAQPGGGVRTYAAVPPPASSGMPVPSQTDLTGELLNTILAQRAYEANATMFGAQSESQKHLIEATG